MLTRILVAAILCSVACGPARLRAAAPDVPLVIGESADGADAATPAPAGAGGPEESPTEPGPVARELGEVPADVGEEYPFRAPPSAVGRRPATDAWVSSTTFDALFMQRANPVGPLAVENLTSPDPGATVIGAGDVRYPTAFGARLFRDWRKPDCWGLEVGYLGVWGMSADALAVSPFPGSLALPGQLGVIEGSGLDAATVIRPALNGNLDSVEINLFTTRTHEGRGRYDPLPWRRVGVVPTADWLLGVRWAGLDEQATLFVTAATPAPNTTAYRVTTSSHLVGPQIGHRRRFAWGDWACEGWVKAAVVASLLSQSQGAIVGPYDLLQVRGPRSSTLDGMGVIGDVNASVVRRFGEAWSLRAGYTFLWLSGVAPAAAQWDFTDTPTSGTRLVPGTVFLHGATLGLETCW